MTRLALLDLDGTLVDSAPGIVSSIRHAYATLGLPTPAPDDLRRFVGPPLHESFARYGVPPASVPDAVAAYREVFAAGAMFDGTRYPGVLECLTAVRARGVRLAVATSKPEVYATQIVERARLGHLVEGVYGATLDGARSSKADVVGYALREIARRSEGLPGRDDVVMVGDRKHDVRGAAAHGIACVGVAWGYADPGELEGAGARAVVGTPSELVAAIVDDLRGPARRSRPAGSAARGARGEGPAPLAGAPSPSVEPLA